MPGSATTAASTRCAATAGRVTDRCPWEHEPNRGFLRALAALTEAAGRIGEDHERDRCDQFLLDSSPEAHAALAGPRLIARRETGRRETGVTFGSRSGVMAQRPLGRGR